MTIGSGCGWPTVFTAGMTPAVQVGSQRSLATFSWTLVDFSRNCFGGLQWAP